jgi:hypothetical protein
MFVVTYQHETLRVYTKANGIAYVSPGAGREYKVSECTPAIQALAATVLGAA